MRSSFTLFRSHLDLAHDYWEKLVIQNDIVIDATCGNGHDTLKLCQLALSGQIYAFDIQPTAVENTKNLLQEHLSRDQMQKVYVEMRSHVSFPKEILPGSVKLIVYNLGYLPGGDKELTTLSTTSLESIKRSEELVMPGGAISITCYPGHPQGAVEQDFLIEYVRKLDPKVWNCCLHTWLNRHASPRLLLIQRASI